MKTESAVRLLKKHTMERPQTIAHTIVPKIPKPLEHIVDKLLQKDKEDRYASAEELIKELERFIFSGTSEAFAQSKGKNSI